MFRRLIALLIVSVGLLSTALPAIACEVAARHGGCCPTDVSSPCAPVEVDVALRSVFAERCVVNRPSGPSLVPVSGGSESGRTPYFGSPDPLLTSLRMASARQVGSAHSILPALNRPLRNDGSLTYLMTARLRL